MKCVSTFSIVALAPNGDLGVAVASKFLAVGSVVPWLEAGVGAVATQSFANTTFGPRGLELMRDGLTLPAVAAQLESGDDEFQQRQFGLVNAHGEAFTFSGSACNPWAGGRTGPGFAAQGNLLAGPQVVDALADTFASTESQPLAERLLAALLAADRAGGDRRGRQSAAIAVVRKGGGYGGFNDRLLDLRVDDHADPVPELERLHRIHNLFFTRPDAKDLLALDDAVIARLLGVLDRSGAAAAGRAWGDETRAAFLSLVGRENLEERIPNLDGVDRVALEYLEERF